MGVQHLYDMQPHTLVTSNVTVDADKDSDGDQTVSVEAGFQLVDRSHSVCLDFSVFGFHDTEEERTGVLSRLDKEEQAVNRLLEEVTRFAEEYKAALTFARTVVLETT